MSDIRKRFGKRGVSWQVRYADTSTGQLRYKSFPRRKDADLFLSELSGSDFVHDRDTITVSKAGGRWLEVCELTGRSYSPYHLKLPVNLRHDRYRQRQGPIFSPLPS